MEAIPSVLQLIREVNASTPNHLASCQLEKLSTDLSASSAGFKSATADRARVQKLMQMFFPVGGSGEGGFSCTCPAASKKCPILFFRAFFAARGPEAMLKKLQENCMELSPQTDTEMEQWIVMIVHQSLVLLTSKVCDTCTTPLTKQVSAGAEPRSIVNMLNRSLTNVPFMSASFVAVVAKLVLGEIYIPDPAVVQKIDEYNGELRKQFNPKGLISAKHAYYDYTGQIDERRKSTVSRKSTAVSLGRASLPDADKAVMAPRAGFDFALTLARSSTLGHRFQAIGLFESLLEQNYRKAECLLNLGLVHFSCDRVGLARLAIHQGLATPWEDSENSSLKQLGKDVLKWTENLDSHAEDIQFDKQHWWVTFPEFFTTSLNSLQAGPVKSAAAVLEHFLKVLNKEQLNNTRVLANSGWQSPLFVLMRFSALRDQIKGFEDEKNKPELKPIQEKVSTLCVHIFSRLAFTYFTVYEGGKKKGGKVVNNERSGGTKGKRNEGKDEDEGEASSSGGSFAASRSVIEFMLESFDTLENTVGFTEITTKLMREILIGVFRHLGTFTNTIKVDSFNSSAWTALFDLLQVAENFIFYSGVNESVSLNSVLKGGSLTRYVVPPREAPRPFKERHFATIGIHFGPKGQCLDMELVSVIVTLLKSFEFKDLAPTNDMSSDEVAACKRVRTKGNGELFFFESASEYLQRLTASNASGNLAEKSPIFMSLMESRQNERLSSSYLNFLRADEVPQKGLKKLLSKNKEKGDQMKKFKSSFVSVQNAQLYFKAKNLLAEESSDRGKGPTVNTKKGAPLSPTSLARGAPLSPTNGPKPAKSSYFSDKAKEDAQSKEQAAALAAALAKGQLEKQQRIADAFVREIMLEPAPLPPPREEKKVEAGAAATPAPAAESKSAQEDPPALSELAVLATRKQSRMKVTHIALEDYEAEDDIEMSIRLDDRLCVTQDKDGWSQATNFETGELGWVPTDFIELVPEGFDTRPPEIEPEVDDEDDVIPLPTDLPSGEELPPLSLEELPPPLPSSSSPDAIAADAAAAALAAAAAAAEAKRAQEAERERVLLAKMNRAVAKCSVCAKGLRFDEVYEQPGAKGKAYCEYDFRKSFFSCGTCGEVVADEEPSVTIPNKTESAPLAEGGEDDDVTFYHMKCLECSVCKMKTDSVELMEGFEGKLFCQNDFAIMRGSPCAWCDKMITGEPLEALGQTWHEDHFMCYGKCGKNLKAEKFCVPNEAQLKYYQAKQSGSTDAARLLLMGSVKVEAHDGGASALNEIGKLTSEQLVVMKDEPYCQSCFTERFKRVCPSCKLEIMEWETGITVGESKVPFHSRCYNCSVCSGQTLSTAPEQSSNFDKKLLLGERDVLYCEDHYYAKFLTKANCNVCKKPLKDPKNPTRACINVQDFEYHADCIRCKVCQVNLSEPGQQTFIHSLLPDVKEAEFYCEPHYTEVVMEADAPSCRHCNRKVVSGGFAIKGNHYHADCKKCKICNIPLTLGSAGPDKLVFVMKNLPTGGQVGDMYCPKDRPK